MLWRDAIELDEADLGVDAEMDDIEAAVGLHKELMRTPGPGPTKVTNALGVPLPFALIEDICGVDELLPALSVGGEHVVGALEVHVLFDLPGAGVAVAAVAVQETGGARREPSRGGGLREARVLVEDDADGGVMVVRARLPAGEYAADTLADALATG